MSQIDKLTYGAKVSITGGVLKGKSAVVREHRKLVLVRTDDGWIAWIRRSSVTPVEQQGDHHAR